jgi:aspartate/methionine/tyrosine aminotransferase
MYVMVEVDTTVLTGIKDDFDFTQKLLDEESVFVLPGQVCNHLQLPYVQIWSIC